MLGCLVPAREAQAIRRDALLRLRAVTGAFNGISYTDLSFKLEDYLLSLTYWAPSVHVISYHEQAGE